MMMMMVFIKVSKYKVSYVLVQQFLEPKLSRRRYSHCMAV